MNEHENKSSASVAGSLLLPLSLVLTTMTNLRLGSIPIGPGEIGLLLFIIYLFLKNGGLRAAIRSNRLIVFFSVFFFALTAGTLISSSTGDVRVSTLLHNSIAYLLSFVLACFAVGNMTKDAVLTSVKYTVALGILVFLSLFLWWQFVANNFFGVALDYAGVRFTGGAKNPNQLALFMVPTPFVALHYVVESLSRGKKAVGAAWSFLLLASIYVGRATLSDALEGTWTIAVVMMVLLLIHNYARGSIRVLLVLATAIVVALAVLLLPHMIDDLYYESLTWFSALDEGGSRASLWVLGMQEAIKSPIFGFGLSFSVSGAEVHNTYIDLFGQAGIVGVLALLAFLHFLYVRIKRYTFITSAFIALLVFAFSHLVLRQPIFWMYLLSFSAYCNLPD